MAGRPGGPPGREGRVCHTQSSARALPQGQKECGGGERGGGWQCEECSTVTQTCLRPKGLSVSELLTWEK